MIKIIVLFITVSSVLACQEYTSCNVCISKARCIYIKHVEGQGCVQQLKLKEFIVFKKFLKCENERETGKYNMNYLIPSQLFIFLSFHYSWAPPEFLD